jgi:hypothetical protein
MRRAVSIRLGLAAVLAAAAGCASVWPLSAFYLERDPGEVALGAKAPPFRLAAARGPDVGLSDLLDRGQAVLVFYRGHW